jgi:outer membrane protein assembly factor BamB
MMHFALSATQVIVDSQSGVIPVIAQAGSAFAPMLALAVTSTVGLLLRPKELVAVLRAKPWIPVLILLLGVALWCLVGWLVADPVTVGKRAASPQSVAASADVNQTDWAQVALALIRQQEAGQMPSPVVATSASKPVMDLKSALTGSSQVVGFRGTASRSGWLGGGSPIGLKPAWSYFAEDDANAMVLSSPIVRDGLVYSASCLLVPPASIGTVACVELATGKQRWLATQADPIKGRDFVGFFSSPALTADGSRLLIGQGLHLDADADLVCLDAQSGAVLWTVHTPLHLESSPAIEGDVVVIGAGSIEVGEDKKPQGDPQGRGNPGFVLGVRISTGEVLFRHPVNDPEGSPVLADGICYIGSGFNGNHVVAFRADRSDAELAAAGQSRELWRVSTPFPATGAVTMADNTLLIGCGNGDFVSGASNGSGMVLALDPKSGATYWTVAMPDAVLGPIAVIGPTGIVPCRNGEILALDLSQQGAIRWRSRVNKQAAILAGAAFTGTHVYAVSNNGYLAVLDARDGTQIERVLLNAIGRSGALSISSPLVVDGRVVVGSETGGLRCFVGTGP